MMQPELFYTIFLQIPEYEMLLRNVLYDSVILVEYHFLNPERLTHLPAKHAKSLALGRLIVAHEAIELLRQAFWAEFNFGHYIYIVC